MTPQHDCDHHFDNHPGEPLACINCGLDWPAVDDWPPEPLGLNPGYGNLDNFTPWGQRVDHVVDELQEVSHVA